MKYTFCLSCHSFSTERNDGSVETVNKVIILKEKISYS